MARLSNWVLPLIAFFIFANPATFKFVASILGNWVANSYGLPTQAGVLLHGLVFIFAVGLLMKRVSFYGMGHHDKNTAKHPDYLNVQELDD